MVLAKAYNRGKLPFIETAKKLFHWENEHIVLAKAYSWGKLPFIETAKKLFLLRNWHHRFSQGV